MSGKRQLRQLHQLHRHSSVSISNNQVLNYNKNGITCNDVGTTCNVNQNTVTFYVSSVAGAPTTSYTQYIAPNGIQIGFGAVGTVTGNTVSDNDIGILTSTDAVIITNNNVQNNRFEGIYLNDGTYTASNNQVSCSHSSSCDIGIAVVSDGYAANPATVSLNNNFNNNKNFNGAFTCPPVPFSPSCAPLQITAYTGIPNGGTNNEPVILTINGISETVTAGSSATPSFTNITSFPNTGPFYP